MAGRGVDIKLGEGVLELGGLYVLGTERHESRRIDNQLRGRSGRQGDPGETRFYLSGEDDLVRLFAGDRIKGIMERFKIPDDQPMEAKILSRQIEGAQKKVEEQNFVMRKNVLKYDDVMNTQRGRDLRAAAAACSRARTSPSRSSSGSRRSSRTPSSCSRRRSTPEEWDLEALTNAMAGSTRPRSPPPSCARSSRDHAARRSTEEFQADARDEYEAKEADFGSELMRELERFVVLQVVDIRWREHLENMEYLREGVHLRAMAQKDPLVEYTAEGESMFTELGRDDPRRGRAAPLPRRARAPQDDGAAAAARSRSRSRRRPAATATSATSTRRAPAPTRSPPPGALRLSRSRPRPRRSRQSSASTRRRPQRPVLVRLRQEVQKCHGA